MPEIRQLPTSVINKIAAGEVIERPSSVVKELVENSVDAGATRIDVLIEKGGTDLIRIADNGCGIEASQLELAVSPHATSKIFSADDLFSVSSMGFRGEALASIAEVSQFLIRSRVADSPSGYQLLVNGGERQPIDPCGCPIGTIMEVRNLFFNTPVRRKFLKTAQTELGHIVEAFTRIALAYPEVHFTLSHNGKLLHELPPTSAWAQRIGHFFGDEIQLNLIPVDSQHEEIQLSGFVVAPTVSRSHNRMQYLFLNGRFIRDRALQHALTEAYRGLLMTGRFPIVFLRLMMPPDQVDVNVHPAKLEVRFQESGKLYSQLLGTLRSKFLSADLAEKVRSGSEGWSMSSADAGVVPMPHAFAATTELACDPTVVQSQAASVIRWAREPGEIKQQSLPVTMTRTGGGNWTAGNATSNDATATNSTDSVEWEPADSAVALVDATDRAESGGPASLGSLPAQLTPAPRRGYVDGGALGGLPEFRKFPELDSKWPRMAPPHTHPAGSPESDWGQGDDREALDLRKSVPGDSFHANIPTGHVRPTTRPQVLQIQQRYLVCENEDGMVVIDQHALHERILYEQIKTKILSGTLESQRLLVPQPVDLTPAEAAAVLEVQDDLLKIGLGVEGFGGGTVLITSYPSLLKSHNLAELLRVVVDQLSQGKQRPDPQDWLDHMLATMACKAAVKAGDRLSQEEMLALIEHRDLCRDAHHCPHGRPSWLVFSQEELDKKFKRI
ncbi:MAG: DNA mismatch repair endonuclease MutL [Planctomycetaceae bacterium]|nr:DNA mismatch repair endonuclease MutL [Planctomycetaceae bacterium]